MTTEADQAIEVLADLKAVDVRRYDARSNSALADWVVIATGEADRHLEAMAGALRARFKGRMRLTREGEGESGWVLVDLGDIVVHLFTAGRRSHYDLDGLFAKSRR